MTTKSKTLSAVTILVVGIGVLILFNQSGQLTTGRDKVVDSPMVTTGDGKVTDIPVAPKGDDKVAHNPIVHGGHDGAVNAPVATGYGEVVDALIARNVAARGGANAWRNVGSLQLTGKMDLGQGLHVPYVIKQKRPGKMCLEFDFDNQTAAQCLDGQTGWKRLPFMGRTTPEAMTEKEVSEMAGASSLDGLLFDSSKRGYNVELIGQESVDDKTTTKLKVTLPGGAVRWVYLDEETGLEVKIEAMRALRGKQRLVETWYFDWQPIDGLLISRRQETRYEGDKESHFVTVESVNVNPPLEDARFAMPTTSTLDRERAQEKSS